MTSSKPPSDNAVNNAWSFQAGDLALDFANTSDWHASDHPVELLNTYVDLVNWSCDYALLTPDEAQILTNKAEHQPIAAIKSLEKAIALRESIYRIFSAIASDIQPGKEDLDKLKEIWEEAIAAAKMVSQGKQFTWTWEKRPLSLEQMLWPISLAAVDLLFSKSLSQVGQCADNRGCGLLFIDTSRNHSRLWCDMNTCGNRAKAHRHYHRGNRKN